MLDIGWDEMLFTAMIAIVVIGPKDLPRALRTAGQWIGKVRRVSGHFRTGIETMIREAEMEDMEQQWRTQNAAIMAAHPPSADDAPLVGTDPGTLMEPLAASPPDGPSLAKPAAKKSRAPRQRAAAKPAPIPSKPLPKPRTQARAKPKPG